MRITRRLEFDAGHRIPDHASLCRHLHGHRYAIEVTVSGEIVTAAGDAERGMVADFGGLKTLIDRHVVGVWDHAFLAHADDAPLVAFLATLPDHRTVLFDAPPTAEHLAQTALGILTRACAESYGPRVRVEQVRLYETPNCWADAIAGRRPAA
jgi:6-pyruvoyltetrahydropterin/6-carboxytetrahydropterin synthase